MGQSGCKDWQSGCECGQCLSWAAESENRPCRDHGRGCKCRQCDIYDRSQEITSQAEGFTCLTCRTPSAPRSMTKSHAMDFWFELRNCKVLLISGHYDSRGGRKRCTGSRRDRSSYLAGVEKDMNNMKRLVAIAGEGRINEGCDLFYEYNSPDDCTAEKAMGYIKRLVRHCKKHNKRPVIYYSGHGEESQGAWCFNNSYLTPSEVIEQLADFKFEDAMIIADCCFAGFWAHEAGPQVQVYAAVEHQHTASDVDSGGVFTLSLLEFSKGIDLDRNHRTMSAFDLNKKLVINGDSFPICNINPGTEGVGDSSPVEFSNLLFEGAIRRTVNAPPKPDIPRTSCKCCGRPTLLGGRMCQGKVCGYNQCQKSVRGERCENSCSRGSVMCSSHV